MKGDPAKRTQCPECGKWVLLSGRPSVNLTTRQRRRRALREHLNLEHAGLGRRAISLILDRWAS